MIDDGMKAKLIEAARDRHARNHTGNSTTRLDGSIECIVCLLIEDNDMWRDALEKLTEASERVARMQHVAHCKDQAEADRYRGFYDRLNEARSFIDERAEQRSTGPAGSK